MLKREYYGRRLSVVEKHHLELAGLALEAPSIERLEAWLRPIGVDEDELTGQGRVERPHDHANVVAADEQTGHAVRDAVVLDYHRLSARRIQTVACLEARVWSDYRDATKPPFYRGSRTPRPDDQITSEKVVIDALEPEGLFVARVARVEDCVWISDDVHTGRTPAAAAN